MSTATKTPDRLDAALHKAARTCRDPLVREWFRKLTHGDRTPPAVRRGRARNHANCDKLSG
jgi:hypothetical protein